MENGNWKDSKYRYIFTIESGKPFYSDLYDIKKLMLNNEK